jgi:polysaccharide biosynthesis transport protein
MEFRHYLSRLRAWLWIVFVAVLLSAALGYLLAVRIPPTYESRAMLLVNVSAGGAPTSSEISVSQQLVKTYSVLATEPVVLEPVATQLGLSVTPDQLARSVSVQPVRDTQLLTIVAQSTRPEEARDIANAVASIFIDQQRQRAAPTSSTDVISIVQPALLPTQPTQPRIPLIVALAAFVGALLTLVALLLRDYLEDRVRTPEQVARASAVPTVGSVARLSSGAGVSEPGLLIGARAAFTPADEAYTLLRTNLDMAALQHPWRVLLVTSAVGREGKSTMAANMALSFAQAGRRVILIDANLRDPKLAQLFEIDEDAPGLGDLLMVPSIDRAVPAALDSFLHQTQLEHLEVLPAGTQPPRPTDWLQSSLFLRLLRHFAERADLVLIDGPAILASADTLVLAQAADATLLVVDTQRARGAAVTEAVDALRHTSTYLVGAVLNRAGRPRKVPARRLVRVA